ncbi:MAG: glycosyltransferase family 4 protein [Bacteroidetes bacterium]|nr:glycosyltransferase family 4 protein [Bacteroidota bacterium]
MRKILVIGNRIPLPARDGGAMATLQILNLYVKADYKVDFVSLNTSKHYVEPNVISQELNFLESVETVSINTDLSLSGLIRNLLFSHKSYNLERFYSSEFEKLIQIKLNTEDYSFIHIESLYAATVLPIVRKYTSKPIYIRVHNVEHQIWERLAENESNWVKKMYLRQMSKRLRREEMHYYSHADGLLHISMTDLNFFKNQFPQIPNFYLPFIVESAKESESLDKIPFSVGYIGSIEWLPNVQGVRWFKENVWDNVRVAIPQSVFRIAGKGIEKQFNSNNHKGIEVVGEVAFSGNFIQQNHVMIVPLFSGSGIRIKTIEAMSKGVPVVSTTIGAQGLDVLSNENIMIADSAKDFAKALIELLTKEELSEKIAINGLKYVSQNHNEKQAIDLLKSLG